MFVLQYTVASCLPNRWNFVPIVLEKSVFYGYLTAASVSVGLLTQFVHCCLVTARAFTDSDTVDCS